MSFSIVPGCSDNGWYMYRYHKTVNRFFGSVIGMLAVLYFYIASNLTVAQFSAAVVVAAMVLAVSSLLISIVVHLLKVWHQWIFNP